MAEIIFSEASFPNFSFDNLVRAIRRSSPDQLGRPVDRFEFCPLLDQVSSRISQHSFLRKQLASVGNACDEGYELTHAVERVATDA